MWGARGVAKAVASAAAKAAAATVTPGASMGAAAEAVTTVAPAAMDTRPAQWQPNCPNESRKARSSRGSKVGRAQDVPFSNRCMQVVLEQKTNNKTKSYKMVG